MKTKNNRTTLDEILDKKYGKGGMPKREEWEQQFQSFQRGVLSEVANELKKGEESGFVQDFDRADFMKSLHTKHIKDK